MVVAVQRLCDAEPCVILSGQSLSAAVDLGGRVLCGIAFPAAWTAAGITFQGSTTLAGTYVDLYTETAEISATSAAASRYVGLDSSYFFGINFLKVRSGTSAAAVAQGADRTLQLLIGRPSVS